VFYFQNFKLFLRTAIEHRKSAPNGHDNGSSTDLSVGIIKAPYEKLIEQLAQINDVCCAPCFSCVRIA
jgi:hypothetical protein